jgi:hypothetical protein
VFDLREHLQQLSRHAGMSCMRAWKLEAVPERMRKEAISQLYNSLE